MPRRLCAMRLRLSRRVRQHFDQHSPNVHYGTYAKHVGGDSSTAHCLVLLRVWGGGVRGEGRRRRDEEMLTSFATQAGRSEIPSAIPKPVARLPIA